MGWRPQSGPATSGRRTAWLPSFVGTVWLNCYKVFDPALPFGGYKQSGWSREMGRAAWSYTPRPSRFARSFNKFPITQGGRTEVRHFRDRLLFEIGARLAMLTTDVP